ncbi:signal peptide peptidase SppA [Desulfobaculum xiamenense]|uniref:Signal peptide peptidase SppA n=1 Tax=Desulfobaculum xiamenense TaxID=995050 RepID=A0A846QHG1_9BACT|nr:signal peptide peptidase SppA [Desulfobaculum xiamenense]NJB66447.1 signal peptide peptidase SppA [Desulfobaculum xiamenense]
MPRTNRAVMELSTRFWALHPDKLAAVADFVAAQLGGTQPPVAARELFGPGEGGGTDLRAYELRDGVAVIAVTGVMERRMNLFQAISGGTSSQQIASRIRQAADDGAVCGILLDIDSPGGSVFAVEEIAEAVRHARASKPVVAHSYGMMCSAAYWVGATAQRVVIGSNAEVGSIGVAYVHYDRSEQDRAAGVHRTVMTAGRYKRVASDAAPLSREGQDYLQSQLDAYYSLFVDAVAEGRGVHVETVLADMADGRTFIGAEAVQAGLADEIGNLETALALARGERRERTMPDKAAAHTPEAPAAGARNASAATDAHTVDTLRAAHPDLVSAIEAQAAATATAAERERVLEIMKAGAGAELTADAVAKGLPPEATYKAMVLHAREAAASAEADLRASLGGSAGQVPQDKGGNRDFMAVARARATADGISITRAMSLVAREEPALHAAYVERCGK